MLSNHDYIDLAMNGVLALIMFGVGIGITVRDLKNIFLYPKAVVIGLLAQMVLMPAVAFVIATLAHLPGAVKVGIVIISICPGGSSSNLVVFMLRGRMALSVSITTLNSLITIFSIPAFTNLALLYFLQSKADFALPFWETVLRIFLVTLLPVAIGVMLRRWKPKITEKLENPFDYILPLSLAAVFLVKIFAGEGSGGTGIGFGEALAILPYLLALNFGGMYLGYYIGKILGLRAINRITISIEIGLQNTALALLVAGTILQNSAMEKPALVYAAFSFFSAFFFGWFMKKATGLPQNDIFSRKIKAKINEKRKKQRKQKV